MVSMSLMKKQEKVFAVLELIHESWMRFQQSVEDFGYRSHHQLFDFQN